MNTCTCVWFHYYGMLGQNWLMIWCMVLDHDKCKFIQYLHKCMWFQLNCTFLKSYFSDYSTGPFKQNNLYMYIKWKSKKTGRKVKRQSYDLCTLQYIHSFGTITMFATLFFQITILLKDFYNYESNIILNRTI